MQINDRITDKLARTVGIFLRHKYDLVSFTATGTNDYNQTVYTKNPPVVDKRCLYFVDEVSVTNERGTSIVNTPTLYAEPSDSIKEGDYVTNVRDRDGNVLLQSAKVLTVNPLAELGSSIVKVCRLEGARL